MEVELKDEAAVVAVGTQKPTVITEGTVSITFPHDKAVFYNPTQVFNRDYSLLILAAFAKRYWAKRQDYRRGDAPLRVLEALAASGLRSLRYAREMPEEVPCHFVVNDISPDAVAAMRTNLEDNPPKAPHSVEVSEADAIALMYSLRTASPEEKFDVVDLDPYGSPASFLDAAMCAVRPGGLLAVTCTDLLTLCGHQLPLCWSRYGAAPLNGEQCHEGGVRIATGALIAAAARHRMSLTVVASFFHAHYLRIFVEVTPRGPVRIAPCMVQHGQVAKCTYCPGMWTQSMAREFTGTSKKGNPVTKTKPAILTLPGPLCPHCGSVIHLGGPLHMGQLYDRPLLELCLSDDISGTAGKDCKALAECKGHMECSLATEGFPPFFISLSQLAKSYGATQVAKDALACAIVSQGFRVAPTPFVGTGIVTDAPIDRVLDIAGLWGRCMARCGHTTSTKNKDNAPATLLRAKGAHLRIMPGEMKKIAKKYGVHTFDPETVDSEGIEAESETAESEGCPPVCFTGAVESRWFKTN
ncbi:tRNA methyltransferase, Trm1, partial [Kipferlia bialata]|eukprot:g9895.t1